MITRRRGRAMIAAEVQSSEAEVVNGDETDRSIQSPSDGYPADDIDTARIELEDLFGIDDLSWTLERDPSSTLFDIELADFSVCGAKDQDSGIEASIGSSPERLSSGLKMKNRKNQPSCVINKNAIAARLNRLKKKEYVTSLEKKVGILSTENNGLKLENSKLTKRVEELEDETRGANPTTMTMPYPRNV